MQHTKVPQRMLVFRFQNLGFRQLNLVYLKNLRYDLRSYDVLTADYLNS